MNTNVAAASYHPRILSPKYGQTGNVKPFTANLYRLQENDQSSILRSLMCTQHENHNLLRFHLRPVVVMCVHLAPMGNSPHQSPSKPVFT